LVQVTKSHEGDPSNQKSRNRQLDKTGSAEPTVEGDGDVLSNGNHTSFSTISLVSTMLHPLK
jgi:hypothetical protein